MCRIASSLAATCALLTLQIAAAIATKQATDLCSCQDLLWRPAAPHFFDVLHWHDKLLGELKEAESFGVSLTTRQALIFDLFFS